jgi:hypothetical protein
MLILDICFVQSLTNNKNLINDHVIFVNHSTYFSGTSTENITNYTILFLYVLLLTIGIETVVILIFFNIPYNSKNRLISVKRIVLTGIASSGTTLPFVWYLFPLFIQNRTELIIITELFAFTVEIPIVKRLLHLSWRKAMIISLFALPVLR